MRTTAWLFILLAFCITGCKKQTVQSPVDGAWKLVYMKGITDSVIFELPGNTTGSVTKMWNGNHFSVVGKLTSDSLVINHYVGGTFSLDGEKYQENVEFHTFPENNGTIKNMKLVIKNDTLIQIWPVNENGDPAENSNIEKYIRY